MNGDYPGPERRHYGDLAARLVEVEKQLLLLLEVNRRDREEATRWRQDLNLILDKFQKVLWGNGKPGVIQECHDNTKWIEAANRLFWPIVMLLITEVGRLVFHGVQLVKST